MEKSHYLILFILFSVALYSCHKKTIVINDKPTKTAAYPIAKKTVNKKTVPTSKVIDEQPEAKEATIDSLAYLRKKYAPLLSANQDELINLSLYKAIDEWMGTPYKYGGNSKNGVDCSGFTAAIYNSTYQIQLARRAADMYAMLNKKVSKVDLKEGDLVFFDIGRRELSHVGVYLTNGKFVHSSTSKGVVISDLEMDYYKKYFRCGGRIIN